VNRDEGRTNVTRGLSEQRSDVDGAGVPGGGAARRARALVAPLVAVAMALASAACRTAPQPVALQQSAIAPKRDLQYTRAVLKDNARPWATLDATCSVVIFNPRIPLPGNQLPVGSGRLVFEKPDKVRLVAPDSEKATVRLIGDGNAFYVDIPVFRCTYHGRYTDPVQVDPARLVFLPPDVADALEPANLLVDRAQTLTQVEQHSRVCSLEFVTQPEPAIRTTSLVVINRATDRLASVEKYNQDGSIRARVLYRAFQSVMTGQQEVVQVPSAFDLTYPEDQTTIRIELRGIVLNSKLSPELFKVEGEQPVDLGPARPARERSL
jgi:hypothetical protein